MFISNIIEHINDCLDIAKQYNLTNDEETKLTLELVFYLQKLNQIVLTSKEHKIFLQKKHLIKQKKHSKTRYFYKSI